MNIIHIGDKILNPDRIHLTVDQVLQLRQKGLTQQEVADRMGIDRTFISRLEGLGEIRKGPQVALIGFHLANARELSEMARENGADFVLLLSEKDSLHFMEDMKGVDLINQFMELISRIKEYDSVIFIGSDKRIKMVESILGTKVVSWEIGISPIKEDRWINPEQLKQLIVQLKNGG
ncbi:MAG: helix-turn-helix domain-containing protein [Peptococcaceae bacterium]|jgi:transcriptional regulator|nr:helix-turn-helix domain-containing protein [Peptococcaceae bacterium]